MAAIYPCWLMISFGDYTAQYIINIYWDILGYIGIYWDILEYIGIYWDILLVEGFILFKTPILFKNMVVHLKTTPLWSRSSSYIKVDMLHLSFFGAQQIPTNMVLKIPWLVRDDF